MIARWEEVVSWDEDGNVDGLQFDSRERRIQQWKEKKEDEEFDRLVAKLKQKKNYRAWYDRHKNDPEFRKKMQAHNRRMRAIHGAKRNAADRERRKQQAEEQPIVNVCQECQAEFTLEFGFKKKRTSKYCSRTCRNRVAQRARKEREAKQVC
jgi:hypothetical protein